MILCTVFNFCFGFSFWLEILKKKKILLTVRWWTKGLQHYVLTLSYRLLNFYIHISKYQLIPHEIRLGLRLLITLDGCAPSHASLIFLAACPLFLLLLLLLYCSKCSKMLYFIFMQNMQRERFSYIWRENMELNLTCLLLFKVSLIL